MLNQLRALPTFIIACIRDAGNPASLGTDAKPNIFVIMADDIDYWNISAYNRGVMGYRTPNIDRIANEGPIFTDYYGQQSCTASRAAFIRRVLGQSLSLGRRGGTRADYPKNPAFSAQIWSPRRLEMRRNRNRHSWRRSPLRSMGANGDARTPVRLPRSAA
jgi:hypothetical protein